MAYRLADMLPGPTVFAYLSDETLESVQSDELSSVYQYRCGCVAVRWLRSVQVTSGGVPPTRQALIPRNRPASSDPGILLSGFLFAQAPSHVFL